MSKIKKSTPPSSNLSISQAKQLAEQKARELINFSFKYLNGDHDKFCYYPNDSGYFVEVLERVRNLSTLTKQELISNRSASLKAHPIDWCTTSEPCFGFPKEQDIVDVPYQFSINRNEHGRVHGFFIYNTFYIVWLDKEHNLYS